jgi:hypothetical protein
MDMRLEPREARLEVRGCDLRAGAGHQRELGATGEEFRGAAFIALDVSLGMCQHRAPGRAERGDGQGIGGGPRRHREHTHAGFEELAEHRVEALRPLVRAIGQRGAVVHLGNGCKYFGADRGGVVGLEVAHGPPF